MRFGEAQPVKQRVLPEEAPPAREKLTVVEVQETAVPESDGIPEQSAAPEPADSLAAALQHGKAALLERGDLATARGHFQAAARSALALGDIDCLGRAALGLGGLWVPEHRTAIEGSRVTAWQRRALEELAPGSQLAARLNLRLIAESDYARGRSTQVLAALDAARCGGDPVVLADALSLAHHCLLGPEHADRRLNLADELLAVAGLTGRTMDSVLGLLWRTVDLLLAADPHAQRSLRERTIVNQREGLMAVEFVVSSMQVMHAIRRGEFESAEQMAGICAGQGEIVGDADAPGWYAAQMVAVRWFQGRVGELFPMLDGLVNSPSLAGPDDSILAAFGVAAASSGHRAQAISAVTRLRGMGLAALPTSSTWLVTLSGVVEAAALLDDAELAAEAYPLLEPYADRPIMASLAVVRFGSVQHSL